MANGAVCVKTRDSTACYQLATMMIRRLALELAAVVAMAAIAGIVLSHMYFAPTLDAVVASHPRDRRVSSPEPAAASETAIPVESDPSANPDELRRAPSPTVPSPHAPRNHGPLTLDLRGVRDPTSLVPGAVMTPNESPEGGYVVRATDRAGFLTSAGVRPGDVLVAINGQPTLSADQLLAAYVITHQASALSLRFRRGSSQFEVAANVLR